MFPTHYGALDLEEEQKKQQASRSFRGLLLAAGVMVALTATVFYATATKPQATVAVVNAVHPPVAKTRDCQCAAEHQCDDTTTADVDGNQIYYCDIVAMTGTDLCIGIDNRYYTETPGYVAGGTQRAACNHVKGRYDCWSEPCFNGGFCVDGVDTYTCMCARGFQGSTCEDDIDECTLEDIGEEVKRVCDENALCTNSVGKYDCECNAGWEGDGYRETGALPSTKTPLWLVRPTNDANYIEACRDIDDCANNPCHNGATCINLEGIPNNPPDEYGYDCECTVGLTGSKNWLGHDCDIDEDECASLIDDCDIHAQGSARNPTIIGDGCQNTPGAFTCSCDLGWTPINPATGVDHQGRADNPTGPGCYDYDNCGEGNCQNGATCTEGFPGAESRDIEDTVDEEGRPMPGGRNTYVAPYFCTCAYGWTGRDCELDENECTDSEEGAYETFAEMCHDEAFCTNTPGSYECACNAGWTGDGITCIDADDCEFSPCAHGGTCYDCGTLCFTCDCVAGWRGTTCATDWNECIMGIHLCNDEATCVNNPGSYDCRCDPGFTGDGFGQGFVAVTQSYVIGANTVTETTFRGCKDIDDCDPALYDGPTNSPNGPCIQGTCTDLGPNAYLCTCVNGWKDKNCDMDENECDYVIGDNDCHRFATCKNTAGSYTCQCNEGFTGNGYSSCLDISDCYGQCEHGFCSDLGTGHFRCTCDNGYMDMMCDRNINECATFTHNCARFAQCTDTDGSFTCACNGGWSGDGYAEGSGCKDIDDCASDPCDYGDCTDEGAAAYTCECAEGFTDFNCDFDINECYLKTHNCHVDARCVNVPGGYFCRCLSGWEGDGLTCTDLDDCDPDPCDPIHGTCEDLGPNLYVCNCMPGWTGIECGGDEDECTVGTHGCDPAADCSNTFGSHECVCHNEFYGDGVQCTPCTVCDAGWKREGVCDSLDYSCVNIDECMDQTDNCHDHATCSDNQGSFKCECDQNGDYDEWWGIGINTRDGCQECTVCYDGYHEIQPCTSTTNRVCEINVADGLYMIESEADDNKMCVALLEGEWYPSRMNYGNGDEFCGIEGADAAEKKTNLLGEGEAIFKFDHVGNNNDQDIRSGGDMYTISFNSGDGYECLFFGNKGKDIYPSTQNCMSFDLTERESCPWANGKNKDFCGLPKEDVALSNNLWLQAVWRITPLKLNENKYILQSASKKRADAEGNPIWECLAFEEQGAATNPSRYNWGNGDAWCGAGDWEGEGKVVGLLNNKQAVMILTFLQAA
jgi:hypothetical protein